MVRRAGTRTHRRWKSLTGDVTAEARPAQFTIELLARATPTTPIPAQPTCIPNNNESMLDPITGTIKIRSTGRSGPPGAEVKRSVVATLRRKGFLDYLYFTNFETSDPEQQILSSSSSDWAGAPWRRPDPRDRRQPCCPTRSPSGPIAPEGCRQWMRGGPNTVANGTLSPGRNTTGYQYSGLFNPDDARPMGWHLTSTVGGDDDNITCSNIQFAPDDVVAGPFHSNDTIRVCGRPTFGRANMYDKVEYWAYTALGGGSCPSSSPNTPATTVVRTGDDAGVIPLPSTNTALKATTFSAYRFEGRTDITLNGATMSVLRAGTSTPQTMPLPPNGLIYVDNQPSPACLVTNMMQPYLDPVQCGDVILRGNYSRSLTIASKHDIRIAGNVTRTSGSDSLLGLIADGFIRIEHRVASYPCDDDTEDSPANTLQPRTVEAAILSLNRVFTVDNYQCGDDLGDLTVRGAIAQNYRGPVGTGGTGGTGYIKRYEYDQRFRFRSPPYFLTPVDSAWQALRTTEQSPAR